MLILTSAASGAWTSLLVAALLAVALGYAYLFVLSIFPGTLVWVTLALAVVLPSAAGGIMLWGWWAQDQEDAFLAEYDKYHMARAMQLPSTGDDTWDLAIGISLSTGGLLVVATACCLMKSIKLAIGSVEAACDCLLEMPSLLLLPLIAVVSKACLLGFLGYGLALLISCGEVSRFDHLDITEFRGVTRTFVYEKVEVAYLSFSALAAVWILEIASALEHFLVAYCAQEWFFREYRNRRKAVPCCLLIKGACLGLTFHLGTFALGALVIPPFRGFRSFLALIYKRVNEKQDDDEDLNSVTDCLLSCCFCCMGCWEGCIKFMSKDAYAIVAVESLSLFPAAHKAFDVVSYQLAAVGSPGRAIWIFQCWGLACITGLGVYSTWLLIHTVDVFRDPKSWYFVQSPEPVVAVAGVICFVVATTFMAVHKNTADTILFCWSLERRHCDLRGLAVASANHVPKRLEAFLERSRLEALLERGGNAAAGQTAQAAEAAPRNSYSTRIGDREDNNETGALLVS